jgi:large subunit ribosomal protein L28
MGARTRYRLDRSPLEFHPAAFSFHDPIFDTIAAGRTGLAHDTRSFAMTRRCELTGKLPLSGQNKSHSEMKTKRKFRPNLCNVTLMSEKLGRKIRVRVSAHGLKTVEHRGGLDAFLLKAKTDELSLALQRMKADLIKAGTQIAGAA